MEGKKVKEKTRDLAHSRRKKENDTFTDIAQSLPIQENAKDLDKASILRVAIHYLKLRDMIRDGSEEEQALTEEQLQNALNGVGGAGALGDLLPPDQMAAFAHMQQAAQQQAFSEEGSPSAGSPVSDVPSEPLLSEILPNFSKDVLQALDGFMMIVSREGRILYVSESIANYLGLRQVDVIGVHVQELIHPQDCSEVAAIFQTQGHDIEQIFDAKDPMRRKFVVRMRCAFTPSVRSITRCSNFKPIYCSCFLKFARSGPNMGQFTGIVALCKLASIPRLKEMVVGTFFKTKHSLDLSYTAIDTRIRWILGYDPSEMVGLKAYQYFHPEDLTSTSSCHMNLLSRGRSHSPCYRFLSHWGDWIWVRSKSHMIFNTRSQLPEAIVIYTWIVRIDEEDERMKAIKAGDSGEDKVKKYEPFDSEVTSENGKLDVAALANPLAPAGSGLNEAPAPIKTIKQEAKSSPPPPDVCESHTGSPKDLMTPPSSIMGDIKPVFQGSPSADILSPQSDASDCPPNVNPFSSSPTSSLSHYKSSPEHQTSYSPHGGSPAEVIDQTALFSQQQLQHHSFMPSPPYTPYNNSPPAQGDMQQYPPSTVAYEPNDSPYSGVSALPPLNSYKMRRSLSPSETSSDGCQYGNTSPPYSVTSVPQTLPLVGGVHPTTPQQSQTPAGFQQPGPFGYVAPNGFVPSSVVGSTTPPQVPAMSVGTPSPSVEMPSTFYTHGSAITFQPVNGFGDPAAHGLTTDLHFIGDTQTLGSNYSIRSIPVTGQGRVRQTVINDARVRYSGVMPTGHFVHTTSGRPHVEREATESISQWSQWLKSGAPAGSAPPVY